MPIKVLGKSLSVSEIKTDKGLSVQKPFLRTIYFESNGEEDIDLKSQFRNKNPPNLSSIRETASKDFVDKIFNNPSTKKTQLMLFSLIKILIMLDLSK